MRPWQCKPSGGEEEDGSMTIEQEASNASDTKNTAAWCTDIHWDVLVPKKAGETRRGSEGSPSWAHAALLRWWTPIHSMAVKHGIFMGWRDGLDRSQVGSHTNKVGSPSESSCLVTYAEGLHYHVEEGWYEFRCDCRVPGALPSQTIADWLGSYTAPQHPNVYAPIVRAYLQESGSVAPAEPLVYAIATWYARMMVGDGMMHLWNEWKGKGQLDTDHVQQWMVLILLLYRIDQSSQYKARTIQDERVNIQFILRWDCFQRMRKQLNSTCYFDGLWALFWACLFALNQGPFTGFLQNTIQNIFFVFRSIFSRMIINTLLNQATHS
jgi:hypothetical protein